MRAFFAKPIAQPVTSGIQIRDVQIHMMHSAHGPNVPALTITFAHIDAKGNPHRGERIMFPYADKVRELFEREGPVEGKVLDILAAYFGTDLSTTPGNK